jgi:sugar/nucleoside kinase (ribokinase family)
MSQHDFIVIGDVVIDCFIRLKDPSAHIDIDHEVREICMRFAEKVPYEEVYIIPAVGNAGNAAVSAARLGMKTALVTNIGGDQNGKDILAKLAKESVAREFIRVHSEEKTNYHYVLWYQDERTILTKHQKYDYTLPDIGEPRWVYFSSTGENSLPFHDEVLAYLAAHPSIKLAYQPGHIEIKMGVERLKGFYERAYITFYNKEEAQKILDTGEKDMKVLLKKARELGPEIAVITDGKEGTYTFDGKKMLFLPIYSDPKPPLERTGVGDSFSSAFTVFLAKGMTLEEALIRAPINSMSVAQYVGAQEGLLSEEKIEEYLKDAPADYKPKEI